MTLYVALDGPDGCGKSSQAQALAEWLRERCGEVVHVREPGSTPVGEALRELLLAKTTGALRPISEALLFSAARAELVRRVIAPALDRGAIVIAERCYLSTWVYQGLAACDAPPESAGDGAPEPVDTEWLWQTTRLVHGACLPDLVLVLDVATEVAAARRGARGDDRIEARGEAYQRRVRAAYLRAAEREVRAQVVDANRPFDEVQVELRERLAAWLR